MPRTPIDYSQICIYKLVHKEDYDNENIYIGSTTNFRKRKNLHKSSCNCETNKHYNESKYTYIRNNGGWDMWDMIEIEKYPCNDKREAETRERHWIEFYKSNLNSYIPTRSYKESHRKYYQDKKERIKEVSKKYYQDNKERLKEDKAKYYQDNRENTLEKWKKKVTCECGCEVSKNCISKHKRTAKHLQLLNSSKEVGTYP